MNSGDSASQCKYHVAIVYDPQIPGAIWFTNQLAETLENRGYRIVILDLSQRNLIKASHQACITILVSHFTPEGYPAYSNGRPVLHGYSSTRAVLDGRSKWIILGCNLTSRGFVAMLEEGNRLYYAPPGLLVLDTGVLEDTVLIVVSRLTLSSPPPSPDY